MEKELAKTDQIKYYNVSEGIKNEIERLNTEYETFKKELANKILNNKNLLENLNEKEQELYLYPKLYCFMHLSIIFALNTVEIVINERKEEKTIRDILTEENLKKIKLNNIYEYYYNKSHIERKSIIDFGDYNKVYKFLREYIKELK